MSPSTPSLRSLLPLLLAFPLASSQSTATCSDISEKLASNASTTRNMTALQLVYLGSGTDEQIQIQEDTGKTWSLSAYIQPATDSSPIDTQATLWLDTGDSNRKQLGERMGMCHNYMPVQCAGNFSMSKEVLERSLEDEGDCTKMLGEECKEALESYYRDQAVLVWYAGGNCANMENALPAACEGLIVPSTIAAPLFGASFPGRMPNRWNLTSPPSPSSRNITAPTCDSLSSPVNLNQSYGTSVENVVDYDVALNFPVVDIMTFFPIVDNNNESRVQSPMVTQVRFACLRPEVQEGSRQPKTAREVLDGIDEGKIGGDSGAAGLVVGHWAALVFAMAVMFALNM